MLLYLLFPAGRLASCHPEPMVKKGKAVRMRFLAERYGDFLASQLLPKRWPL